MDSRINTNTVEKIDLINTAISMKQFKKLLTPAEFKSKMVSVFGDASILNYYFENDEEKAGFITYFVSLTGLWTCVINTIFSRIYPT